MSPDSESSKSRFADLRKRAHAFSGNSAAAAAMPTEDVAKLVHELDIYQIELELQNEDLRLAQKELNQSRQKFSDLYDFAPVGYLTISDKGLILEANLAAADMLGVERIHLLKLLLSSCIFAEDLDIHYNSRRKLLEANDPQSCELRLKKKDGSIFHGQLQYAINPTVDGISGQFRLTITDISEQKQLEANLLRSKEEWEKTFDAMGDIVTIQDKDMKIIRANKATKDLFALEYGELVGRYCYDVFQGIQEPCKGCPALDTLCDMKSHSEIIKHETLGKIFQITTAAIPDTNGEMQLLVHTAKDITEQKTLEEELFQAHKMEAMGTLAGGIAHDFNNILGAIIGFSEFVRNDLPEDSRSKEDIEAVISSSQRAVKLVKQILSFSCKTDQRLHPFQPHLIVKEAMKMLQATLPATIAMEINIDSESGSVLANPTNIHQIVLNICTNAYHAMENEKGTLTVNLSRTELQKEDIVESAVSPGPFIRLSIQDTGQGMDKKTIARIFEPYFTTKDVSKGNGLGLAVVHGIIKTLHGFIQVESEPGKGSTFHVYIPAIEKDGAGAVSATIGKTDFPKGAERILVVDDESMLVSLNKKILEELGYTVTTTTDSREALEKIRSHADDFDLVITDQAMPGLSGGDLAQEVLKIRPDIPIILCSGYSSVISEKEALALGIKKYAAKPVDLATLAQIVREVLDEK